MGSNRGWLRVAVTGLLLVYVTAACSGAGGQPPKAGAPTTEPRQGGTIVIGAGEPPCADWYGPCGSGSYGILALQTLPSPMAFIDGQYRTTPLLASEPTVDPGPPQRVTYRIDPRAVWSDGTPITSADFRFTWEEGRGANVRGMGDITAVDDADPRMAVVTWREASATWRDRFRPIVPKHLLDGKDRSAEMKDGYRFSGGPWMLDHWTRGQSLTIVRNPRYWGKPAYLDSIVSVVISDPTGVRQAYKSNQIDMFIAPGAEPNIEEMRTLPETGFEALSSLRYSFLAFNTQSPPLDRKAVRQALAYSTDRDAIVTQLQGHLRPDVRPIQALASRANPAWYSEPFAHYRRDLTKVADLMRTDGWTKGPDGVWVTGDVRARVELTIDAAQQFHALFGQIISSQWKEAGFDVAVRPVAVTALNGDLLPKGSYQVAFTGAGASTTDPGQCIRFCSKNIPTQTSQFVGSNVFRMTSPVLDDVWGRADSELDTAKRLDLVRRGQELLADELPALPIASIIDVYVFNNRKLGGPVAIGPDTPSVSEWYCRTACG